MGVRDIHYIPTACMDLEEKRFVELIQLSSMDEVSLGSFL
jgi:hypothetical protein